MSKKTYNFLNYKNPVYCHIRNSVINSTAVNME